MASSLISSSLHIDFDSVFGIDDAGLVQIDGMVVSTIGGTTVEISEEIFAAAFVLPTEGLTDLSEVPKDLVFDARSLFSESKEQVSISCHKREMKIEYRLLSDILAKTIYVKAGQAKGYAIQICVLLKNVQGLELGESKAFPTPRILTEKTVHRYVVINEKVGAEEVVDAPKVKKAPKAKAASKKRPADVVATEPVAKKKRATKKKSDVEMIDEPVSLPAEAVVVNKDVYTADDVDVIIEQVLAETIHIGADEEEQDVDTSDVGDKTAETTDGEKHWFDLSYEAIMAQMDAERPVVTPSDTDEEMESIDVGTDFGDQQLQTDVATDSRTDAAADLFVEESVDDVEVTADEKSVGREHVTPRDRDS
ncbi:hypothetical protein F511_17554 [Dorcoceras hygrometricum]|uniref:Uncharacterized protein n=1 Tax=Dorcoceras hygrometricum TaxID=472368 RepID=A0A2Z7B8B1_9LAMI|nr:hypothetical protein F511_17554 [Dorcoceras hygrometricum]